MNKEEGVMRLDQLLALWEDYTLFQNFVYQTNKLWGGVKDGHKLRPISADGFRKFILEYKGGSVDFTKYIMTHSENNLITIPLDVLAWNHHSRRIFHLTRESQALLDATSLGGLKWKDIKFPFESFLITLDDSITDSSGIAYDSILLSRIDSFFSPGSKEQQSTIIELRLLPIQLAQYQRFSKSERKKLDSYLYNEDYRKIHEFLDEFDRLHYYQAPVLCLVVDDLSEDVIKDSIEKLGASTGQSKLIKDLAIDSALHMVLNLCLYLENYPIKDSKKERIKGVPSRKKTQHKKSAEFDPTAILDETNIFTVKCHFNMTRSEIETLVKEEREAKSGRIQGTHWRRAHWRRKPYCGHIPMKIAPKDWIPRKLINADRLPNGSLPSGSNTTVQ